MDSRGMELKLRLEPDDVARLQRQRFLKALRSAPTTTQRLSSIYWDTPELDLAEAGVVVRIRAVGRRRILTVKTAGSRGAGLFARREWEWQMAGETPDAVRLLATGLPVFRDPAVAARLHPVFSTELQRTLYRLGSDDWEVTLAVDRGAVGAGDAREPICEVELELAAGQPERLFAMAREVTEAVPARLLSLAKSDRGYRLAAGTPPLPVKSKPTEIRAEMAVSDAFHAIARNCLDQLLANERCLLATRDPEAVHQMRVALRRLRSAIRVFGPVVAGPGLVQVKEEIGWLLGHLGRARDDHVFLAEIVEPVVAAHPATQPLAALRADWLAENEKNEAAALAAVADRRFTTMLLTVAAWVEAGDWLASGQPLLAEPIGPFARAVLAKRDRRLRNAGGDHLSALAPEDLHRARILAKQVRYAGEFFAPLWRRKATRPFLDVLAELQDVLGQLNDIAVARTRLTTGHDGDSGNDGGRAWAAGLIAGWHAGRRPQLLATAEKAWSRYRKTERFWTHG